LAIEVAHVTRDSNTFKFERSKFKFTRPCILLTAALMRQAVGAVSVEKYWPWEPTERCGVHSSGTVGSAARGASAPTEVGVKRRHIVAASRLQLVIISVYGEQIYIKCRSVFSVLLHKYLAFKSDYQYKYRFPMGTEKSRNLYLYFSGPEKS